MPLDDPASDSFTFRGSYLTRALDALKVARHQVRLAQGSVSGGGASSPRLEDALSEAEDELGTLMAQLRDAAEDDAADAEESGEAERVRQAWLPQYRAA